MKKRIELFILFLSATSTISLGQELIQIKGAVIADDEVEGIHILNKSSDRYTVTNTNGRFSIQARLHDTLIISSVKYFTQRINIDQEIIANRKIVVQLVEFVNELDEVVIGKVLTGDLSLDIDVNETKVDINFYDVGIPGYTGPRKTQSQRRLYEATSGSGLIPLNPIINAITGRTKELKAQIKLENKDRYMDLAMSKFANLLFEENTEREMVIQFFLYASDDETFVQKALSKNELEFFDFLVEKKNRFIERQGETEKD